MAENREQATGAPGRRESGQPGGGQGLYRPVPLPPGIDADNVQAAHRHGVLTVTLPKTEQSEGRRFTVQG